MDPELLQQIDVLGRGVKCTRPRCPLCGEPFIGWREFVNEALRLVCIHGHDWVTELFVDYGNWPDNHGGDSQ